MTCGCPAPAVIGVIRMLSTIMPIMFEDPAWDGFWSTPAPRGVLVTIPKETVVPSTEQEAAAPLSEILMNALIDLCFVPGFTAPIRKAFPVFKYACVAEVESEHYIWQAGIGRKDIVGANVFTDRNQTDIVQLMLVCMSKLMYSSASEATPTTDTWIGFMAGKLATSETHHHPHPFSRCHAPRSALYHTTPAFRIDRLRSRAPGVPSLPVRVYSFGVTVVLYARRHVEPKDA